MIELGTIGWEDEDEWYSMGTDDNAGYTLVRVQLYAGRDTSRPLKADVGQGHKLLCQIASGVFYIPNKGTRCYVAVPEGMRDMPGAPVIVATVEKNPKLQFNQDRVMFNFGDDKHIVIRGKSVTIASPTNEFMMIGSSRAGGSPSILLQDATGSGMVISDGAIGIMSTDGGSPSTGKSIFQMTAAKIEFFQDSGVCMQMTSGNWITVGQTATLQGGAVYLGALPTAANPVLWGLAGPAGVPSPSVFVSMV